MMDYDYEKEKLWFVRKYKVYHLRFLYPAYNGLKGTLSGMNRKVI